MDQELAEEDLLAAALALSLSESNPQVDNNNNATVGININNVNNQAAAVAAPTENVNLIPGYVPLLPNFVFAPKKKVKLVLCVRKDLKMSVGKIAAQCSHATLGIYRRLMDSHYQLLVDWEGDGCAKIVLSLNDEKEMNEIEEKAAKTPGLVHHVVKDAGKTQVEKGSRTVIGVVGEVSLADTVTGGLKLL
eukprot:TRINITY_DN12813_c0_g1_i1.p1 TRINITY_DN12813_c0_g1~~TRINITY_DN12813_c0_g1_i1.p1  ORF type:complete len:191 (-),score=41.90 TRINITY_DN12813_c0_g1_i1:154-726(-)